MFVSVCMCVCVWASLTPKKYRMRENIRERESKGSHTLFFGLSQESLNYNCFLQIEMDSSDVKHVGSSGNPDV